MFILQPLTTSLLPYMYQTSVDLFHVTFFTWLGRYPAAQSFFPPPWWEKIEKWKNIAARRWKNFFAQRVYCRLLAPLSVSTFSVFHYTFSLSPPSSFVPASAAPALPVYLVFFFPVFPQQLSIYFQDGYVPVAREVQCGVDADIWFHVDCVY